MTEEPAIPLPYRRDRVCPFDPAPELNQLRVELPVSRVELPSGVCVWLVTRYADARQVLGDTRFSNAATPPWLLRLPTVKGSDEAAATEPGSFIGFDPPEHTKFRRMLAGEFTVKRISQLRPRVEAIVSEHLDAMEQTGPPVDLVSAFAFPIPALVICELLGVPYEDRSEFRRLSNLILDLTQPRDQLRLAFKELHVYLATLIARQRQQPDDGMLGMLIREYGDEISDAEIAGIGRLLLFAGHETTASMLALGTALLLRHSEQAARLRDNPDLTAPAIEELLRYLTIAQSAVIRTATEDLQIGDQPVQTGDYVMVSLQSANRDDELYDDPQRFDVTRKPQSHVAFGHGIHHCIGAPLARMEMQAAFPALLRRFPSLRLAAPFEELSFRTLTTVYGVSELPVAW
ncbi:cytochrome P450 [Actinopolymorpha alba]|uniref:cytochrome P450 n=1 Tax=Actinopolymorpha alba TaxID=533267 RepID=UPI00036E797D|nr:cytochrome P450 [Actinopolymorpha alba]